MMQRDSQLPHPHPHPHPPVVDSHPRVDEVDGAHIGHSRLVHRRDTNTTVVFAMTARLRRGAAGGDDGGRLLQDVYYCAMRRRERYARNSISGFVSACRSFCCRANTGGCEHGDLLVLLAGGRRSDDFVHPLPVSVACAMLDAGNSGQAQMGWHLDAGRG